MSTTKARLLALDLLSDEAASLCTTEAPEIRETEDVSADEIRVELKKLSDELFEQSRQKMS